MDDLEQTVLSACTEPLRVGDQLCEMNGECRSIVLAMRVARPDSSSSTYRL